jgi:hypothetical protein
MGYGEDIDALSESYHCNLQTFKKYYVLTRLYSGDEQYAQEYDRAKTNLVKLAKNLFLVNNEIQNKISRLKSNTGDVNSKIENALTQKQHVAKQMLHIQGNVDSAEQMSKDYTKLYTMQYLSNLSMLLGVFVAAGLYYRCFRRPSQ